MRARLRVPGACLVDVALAALFSLVVVLFSRTLADADLWGHLRFGADLLATRRFPTGDPYSFTSDVRWVNHEWLAEAIIAIAYTADGFGLNVLKLGIIAAVGTITWRNAIASAGAAWSSSARPSAFAALPARFAGGVLTAIVLLTTYTRTMLVRPQLFSVLCFALLLAALVAIERGRRVPLAAIPALFCVWANCHGGWIVGFGTLGLWTAFDVVEAHDWRRRPRSATVLFAALAATLLNPYGFGLWRFLYTTVGLSRPEIADWFPLLALPPVVVMFDLLLPALALAAASIRRRMPPLRHVAIVAMLMVGMFRVGRIDAFVQLAVGILLAPAIVGWLSRLAGSFEHRPVLSRPTPAHAIAAAAMLSVALGVASTRVGRVYVDGPWIPDADAGRFLRQHASNVRLLTWFDWGQYAIWHLAPSGVQVSMDGRRETVYSERLVHEHFDFYNNVMPQAWTYPSKIQA